MTMHCVGEVDYQGAIDRCIKRARKAQLVGDMRTVNMLLCRVRMLEAQEIGDYATADKWAREKRYYEQL